MRQLSILESLIPLIVGIFFHNVNMFPLCIQVHFVISTTFCKAALQENWAWSSDLTNPLGVVQGSKDPDFVRDSFPYLLPLPLLALTPLPLALISSLNTHSVEGHPFSLLPSIGISETIFKAFSDTSFFIMAEGQFLYSEVYYHIS